MFKSINNKTVETIVYIVGSIFFSGYFIFEYLFDMPNIAKWSKDIALTIVLIYLGWCVIRKLKNKSKKD